MATTNLIERQHRYAAVADLRIANIGTGNGITVAIPIGAIVVSIIAQTITAFDSATTTTLTVDDGTTTFVSAVDAKSTGSETVSNTPKFYVSGGTITCSLAETGATATVGRALVTIEYVQVGHSDAGIYAG